MSSQKFVVLLTNEEYNFLKKLLPYQLSLQVDINQKSLKKTA